MDLKKLLVRASSGIIYVAIIVGCILYNRVSLIALTMGLAALATAEFIKITKGFDRRHGLSLLIDIAASVALSMSFYLYPILIWIALIMFRLILELYMKEDNPISNLAYSMMSQIYIALPFALMTAISEFWKPNVILLIFILIWVNDTGAYLVGSTIGRHRLFLRISPKKSWEGFFGGLLFTIATGLILCRLCPTFFSLPQIYWLWAVIAAIATVAGTWGDLVESMIKRRLHLKDSGNIIPGHGGILDRIDSLLLVVPAVFLFLMALTWTTDLL